MSFVVPDVFRFFHPRGVARAIGFVLPLVHVTVAFAQTTGGTGGTTGAPAPAGGAPGAPGTVTTVQGPTTTQFFPGGVAPTAPGQNLGGGNAQYSSSKPVMGPNDRDSFDFRNNGGGPVTVRGNENGSFILGSTSRGGAVPNIHNVRRGDTLWGICDYYFRNPYQWPRIWSYNAQIQNPHWIYPGDQVRLRIGGYDVGPNPGPPGLTDRRAHVPAETVFLRNQGYIDDDTNNWGELNGAREDKMILTDFDEVYVRISSSRELKVGQELTIFRPIRKIGSGKLIEIQGTVKVDQWNPKERIARARITETLDAIERGARVGPIQRRFEIVPPTRNEKDVEATILTSVTPNNFFGQNQVVFIDRGEDDGLKPGNRFFVIRRGDGWHRTQPSEVSATRIALEDDSPAATEKVPKPRSDRALPEEVLAELRVINVRKKTSMAIVTRSEREIETGDRAFSRKGY